MTLDGAGSDEPVPPPSPGPPEPPVEPPVPPLPGALAFVGLGTTIAGCVAAGVLSGLAVDAWLHSSPIGLVVGLVLGLIAAVGAVTALVRRYL